MNTTQKKKNADFLKATGTLAWNFILGCWFFEFIVAGTPIAPQLLGLVFAVFFFYRWVFEAPGNSERLRRLQAHRGRRIGHAIIEALTILWGAAGWGALVVWFWMVDLQQISAEAMQKAHEKSPIILWLVVVVAVILGGFTSYHKVWTAAAKGDQLSNDGPVVENEQ